MAKNDEENVVVDKNVYDSTIKSYQETNELNRIEKIL